MSWWWVVFVVGLLAVNFYASSRATQAQSRVRVPYSPYFLNKVNAGDVKEITSKGTASRERSSSRQKYQDNKPTTNFRTEIPAFANTDQLSKLLQSKGVVVNAKPLDTGPSWWRACCSGSARRSCSSGCWCC